MSKEKSRLLMTEFLYLYGGGAEIRTQDTAGMNRML
jgi:hypothetical protein